MGNRYFKTAIALTVLVLTLGLLPAQKIKFTATAKKKVGVKERFRLTYAINAEASGFEIADLAGFQVLSGPNPSKSTSVNIINGRQERSVTNSYSFILLPQKTGTFTIPPAKITANGKTYTSNSIKVQVVKDAGNNDPDLPQVGPNDLFVRLNLSKNNPYRGEAIVASLKLYLRTDLQSINYESMPTYNGFWVEEFFSANRLDFRKEKLNGKPVSVATLNRTVLIPQRSGELEISEAKLIAGIPYRVKRERRSFFDIGWDVRMMEKKLTSPRKTVKVRELPSNSPAGFTGGVGDLKVEVEFDTLAVRANEGINLRIKISGNGNLKLIDPPALDFPEEFEVYDPEVKDKVKVGPEGMSGSRIFDYLIIPRRKGNFTFPKGQFSWFDLDAEKYRTQSFGPWEFEIAKGDGSEEGPWMAGKTDVQVLGEDIRYLKTGDLELHSPQSGFMGSVGYFLLYLFPVLLLAGFGIGLKKYRESQADEGAVRNRKAGKIARKHLKTASEHLEKGEKGPFYKAILSGLWGYLSDKLSLPLSGLTKIKAQEALSERKVPEMLIKQLVELLDRCEFAQFAPGGGSDDLKSVYQSATKIIEKLEEHG